MVLSLTLVAWNMGQKMPEWAMSPFGKEPTGDAPGLSDHTDQPGQALPCTYPQHGAGVSVVGA